VEPLGVPIPDKHPPDYGSHYVGWFWGIRRFISGNEDAITPSLVKEWRDWSGVSLSRREEGIIYAMDAAFRSEMPKAIAKHEERRETKRKLDDRS
jgi:hypothetical protein